MEVLVEDLQTFFNENKGEVVGLGSDLTLRGPVCVYLTATGCKHIVIDSGGLITHLDENMAVQEITAGPGVLVFLDLIDAGSFGEITGAQALEVLEFAGKVALDNFHGSEYN